MHYITTFSKTRFSPVSPETADIKIEDIGHALSLLCRANGHIRYFFSIAQHSLNCAYEAKARGYADKLQLACLLHDASEAYLSDITRPVKAQLPEYRKIEDHLQSMVYSKFLHEPLTSEEITAVDQIDDAMLYYEFRALMGETVFDVPPQIKSAPCFCTRDFGEVEAEFLSAFLSLTGHTARI